MDTTWRPGSMREQIEQYMLWMETDWMRARRLAAAAEQEGRAPKPQLRLVHSRDVREPAAAVSRKAKRRTEWPPRLVWSAD
jgi:hypothetical protein